jgi:ATP/ADP translocase
LEYLQDERKFGQPSYSFSASYELAIHTIFKFSRFPAHFTTFSGIVLLIAGILFYLLHALSLLPNNRHTFFVPLFLMLSGCVFLAGGIICWYLYFILEQVRHDPTYIIEEAVSSSVKPE